MNDAIEITSHMGNYAVHFESDIDKVITSLSKIENNILIVDKRVARFYSNAINTSHFPCLIEIDATEENKTLGKCEEILKFISVRGAHKGSHLVGIGGGIIQDLVTFCAHIYFRGLEWTYVPTTLLGMADSCIGAKASINFLGYKNQLGVFHSPREVWICTGFLKTLPEAEIRSGYGEIVKLHLIEGPQFWRTLLAELNLEGLATRDHEAYIRSSLKIKKSVIEVDEFDCGLRKTLNYGHTFGHALESITSHQVPHGIAIAWGMDLINFVAYRSGRIPESQFLEIHACLSKIFSWEISMFFEVDDLLKATRRDKKSVNGCLRLVLPNSQGRMGMVPQEYTPELRKSVSDYLMNFSILKQVNTIS